MPRLSLSNNTQTMPTDSTFVSDSMTPQHMSPWATPRHRCLGGRLSSKTQASRAVAPNRPARRRRSTPQRTQLSHQASTNHPTTLTLSQVVVHHTTKETPHLDQPNHNMTALRRQSAPCRLRHEWMGPLAIVTTTEQHCPPKKQQSPTYRRLRPSTPLDPGFEALFRKALRASASHVPGPTPLLKRPPLLRSGPPSQLGRHPRELARSRAFRHNPPANSEMPVLSNLRPRCVDRHNDHDPTYDAAANNVTTAFCTTALRLVGHCQLGRWSEERRDRGVSGPTSMLRQAEPSRVGRAVKEVSARG